MPDQNDFFEFLKRINIDEETAQQLWNAKICSIKQLASTKPDKLAQIINDDVLINTLHPLLHKYAFPITMASNPYEKAWSLIQKALKEDEEAMDTSSPVDGVQSDAQPFQTNTSKSDTRSSQTSGTFMTQGNSSKSNAFNSGVLGGKDKTTQTGNGNVMSISITGGNFVQSAVGNTGKVVYNNRDTTVGGTERGDAKSQKVRNESQKVETQKTQPTIKIKDGDRIFSTSDLHFFGYDNYWLDQFEVRACDPQSDMQESTDQNIYPVQPWNSNQALIINMTEFDDRKHNRNGGEVDRKHLEKILPQLGFQVTVCENKNKVHVEQSLREFVRVANDARTSISLVFIGSHGNIRENDDVFVCTDLQRISVKDVMNQFNGTNCPHLRGKPKLFLFQFCRSGVESDAIVENLPRAPHHAAHDGADMMWAFASAAGTKAYRDTEEGSWFVTALCTVLRDYANKEHLLDMMLRVNSMVRMKEDRDGNAVAVQLSEVHSTLEKKVRFYPQGPISHR